MEQTPSWEADSRSTSWEIPPPRIELEGSLPWSREPPAVPVLSQMNPINTLSPYFPTVLVFLRILLWTAYVARRGKTPQIFYPNERDYSPSFPCCFVFGEIQSVQNRCVHKVNILYYNVYTFFWDTLYIKIFFWWETSWVQSVGLEVLKETEIASLRTRKQFSVVLKSTKHIHSRNNFFQCFRDILYRRTGNVIVILKYRPIFIIVWILTYCGRKCFLVIVYTSNE
jgi:hypothetical protein